MKKIYAVLLPFVLMSGISGVTYASMNTNEAVTKTPTQLTNLAPTLFVMFSKQAMVSAVANKPGTFQLSLQGVNPKVVYFSDKPARISGHLSTEQFLGQWKNGSFSKIAPNAVIEAVAVNAKTNQLQPNQSSYAVVLNKPTYNKNTQQLSFEISALPSSKAAIATMTKSDYVAIFVDSGVCLTCTDG